ncbi:MAG TPA: type II toxin-antitoxin system PemK/MazF family toxin [Vicinamibacterales bacterium]|nr:type II toxin-antitoxin system PemK/MazF family toxin [Vicinamibacterales bacterium]
MIVAPMTTGGRAYPWRPRCRFQGHAGFVALDQLRTVDAERLVKSIRQLDSQTVLPVLRTLQETFCPVTNASYLDNQESRARVLVF